MQRVPIVRGAVTCASRRYDASIGSLQRGIPDATGFGLLHRVPFPRFAVIFRITGLHVRALRDKAFHSRAARSSSLLAPAGGGLRPVRELSLGANTFQLTDTLTEVCLCVGNCGVVDRWADLLEDKLQKESRFQVSFVSQRRMETLIAEGHGAEDLSVIGLAADACER